MDWKDYKMPTYINGPFMLSVYYHKDTDKLIYVFGDFHMKNKPCRNKQVPDIKDVIKDILRLYPGQIDFFLEIAPKNLHFDPEQKMNPGFIFDVQDEFQNCFHPKQYGLKCEYPNTRFHYIDIRLIDPTRFKRQEYKDAIEYLRCFQILLKLNVGEHNPEILLKLIDMNKNVLELVYHLFLFFKLDKQLHNVPKLYQDTLINVFKKKLRELGRQQDKTQESTLQYSIDFLSIFFDFYLVARTFRKFSDGDTPHNIIVYAGNFHAVNLSDYYEALGCALVAGEISPETRYHILGGMPWDKIRQCLFTGKLQKWFTRPVNLIDQK